MKENNMSLTILSRQQAPGEKEEQLLRRAPGRLVREGEAWVLEYEEEPFSGLGQTRTILRVEEGQITLLRQGDVVWETVFRPGSAHTAAYRTPYGDLETTVHTLAAAARLTEAGGSIEIDYHMELNGQSAGVTRLRMDVQERERA